MIQRSLSSRIRNAIRWRRQEFEAAATNVFSKIGNEARWIAKRRPSSHSLPGELVISLTSYAPRFGTLALTLKSLITQSVSFDRLVLWIGYSDEKLIPREVRYLEKYGLEIKLTDDIGPYTKIIPSLEAYPEAFILTVDDDIYYPANLVEQLVEGYLSVGAVICHRAHEIMLNESGEVQSYALWRHEVAEPLTSELILPTGVGGVLYPPGSLPPATLDKTIFMSVCPGADDIWLYWMGRRNGNRFHTLGHKKALVHWDGTQDVGLFHENLANGNDTKIRNMIAHFGMP
jgi:hypothetical protein